MLSRWLSPAAPLAMASMMLTIACGGGGEERRETTRSKAQAAAPAGGGGYTVAAVTDGGTVKGSVKFQGTPPQAEKVEVSKDPQVCGKEKVVETVQVGAGGGLKDVVVWIDGITKGKDWSGTGTEVDQESCHYKPYIQIVRVGDSINIKNSDAILHNIHAYHNETETLFNLAQPIKGMVTPKKLEKTGPVHFKCDVHSWMSAYAFVASTPYYTISDSDGAFMLTDVPAGSYKAHAWHSKFGEKTADVTVAAGGAAEATFTMP